MKTQCLAVLLSSLAFGSIAAQTDYKDKQPSEWVLLLKSQPGPSFEALVQSGTPAQSLVPAVLAAMSEEIHIPFSHYFNTLGSTAVPALEKELERAEPPMRRRAAIALGFTLEKDPQPGLKVLAKALGDSDADVRKFAAHSMSVAGVNAAPFALELQRALADRNPDVSLAAATALMRTGCATEETVAAMLVPLSNESAQFKGMALHALVDSPLCMVADKSIPVFRAAMVDAHLRYFALIGFEKMGPLARVAIPEIEALMKSENRSERYWALSALQSIRQTVPPDLEYLSKQVLVVLKRDDLRKQTRFLSRNFNRNADDLLFLDAVNPRGWDRMLESGMKSTIGTTDYAIIKRMGLSMEFVFEDGAWKLLYISFSMC